MVPGSNTVARLFVKAPNRALSAYICAVQLPPTGPPGFATPNPVQPYGAPEPPAYHVAPTDTGAVWTLVLGILAFFTCPILGLIAFFTGGSAINRIQASQGRLDGDGIARVGRILGCVNVVLWLVVTVGLFLVFAACGVGLSQLSHLPIPSPSP